MVSGVVNIDRPLVTVLDERGADETGQRQLQNGSLG